MAHKPLPGLLAVAPLGPKPIEKFGGDAAVTPAKQPARIAGIVATVHDEVMLARPFDGKVDWLCINGTLVKPGCWGCEKGICDECGPDARERWVAQFLNVQECPASGAGHRFGPHGPKGEEQCQYCGNPPPLERAILEHPLSDEAEAASRENLRKRINGAFGETLCSGCGAKEGQYHAAKCPTLENLHGTFRSVAAEPITLKDNFDDTKLDPSKWTMSLEKGQLAGKAPALIVMDEATTLRDMTAVSRLHRQGQRITVQLVATVDVAELKTDIHKALTRMRSELWNTLLDQMRAQGYPHDQLLKQQGKKAKPCTVCSNPAGQCCVPHPTHDEDEDLPDTPPKNSAPWPATYPDLHTFAAMPNNSKKRDVLRVMISKLRSPEARAAFKEELAKYTRDGIPKLVRLRPDGYTPCYNWLRSQLQ